MPRDSRPAPLPATWPITSSRSETRSARRHSSRAVDVRQVHLDRGQRRRSRVRPGSPSCSGSTRRGSGSAPSLVSGAWCRRSTNSPSSLVWKKRRLEAQLARPVADAHLELDQRQRSVVLRDRACRACRGSLRAAPRCGSRRPLKRLLPAPADLLDRRAISWSRHLGADPDVAGLAQQDEVLLRRRGASCRGVEARAARRWTGRRSDVGSPCSSSSPCTRSRTAGSSPASSSDSRSATSRPSATASPWRNAS